jgi:hypothetical protein
MSAPIVADPVVLAAVVRAAQKLNAELRRLPGVLAIVSPERAALQVQLDSGGLDVRMELVDAIAGLIKAEPGLIEESVGSYWQATGHVDGVLVETFTLLRFSEEVEG